MEQITKEEIKKIMEIKGKVRGVVFQTDAEYVREKIGEKGLEKLEIKTKELGHPIDYDKIKAMDWYPLGLRVLSLLAIKEAFNWGDKEIKDMGNSAPKYSFIVRMLMKYFLSAKRSFKESPKYWVKHYTVGKLEAYKFNEKEKYLVLRLNDFKIHPLLCTYYLGYFLRIAQYVIQSEEISIEETQCMFKDHPYHEFLIRWK
jgi:hypothetical protein